MKCKSDQANNCLIHFYKRLYLTMSQQDNEKLLDMNRKAAEYNASVNEVAKENSSLKRKNEEA